MRARLLLGSILLLPFFAYAHGTGLSLTERVNAYRIDIDFTDYLVTTETSEGVSFKLFTDDNRTQPAEFDDVFVKILTYPNGRQRTYFSGRIMNDPIYGANLHFIFPEPDSYTISVAYEKRNADGSSEILATNYFRLNVERGWSEHYNFDLWSTLTGLMSGIAACATIFIFARLLNQRAQKSASG